MSKKNKPKRLSIVGGNKAATVNPLGLRFQFKAVCVTHNVVTSTWRDTRDEAEADLAAFGHSGPNHFIDFNKKITN